MAKQPVLDAIVVDQLDLGEAPLRLAGVKVYNTKDDEVIMECPIQWGSLMKVRSFEFCQLRAGPVHRSCITGRCHSLRGNIDAMAPHYISASKVPWCVN